MRPIRRGTIALALALAGAPLALPERALAQDMMTTCAAEIGSLCPGITRGRGRITACLISYSDRLSAACGADVRAVAQSGSRNPLVPSGVRNMMGSGQAASVPAACSADAGRFCSGVSPTNDRVLACLYAHSNRVSGACSSGVKSTLN